MLIRIYINYFIVFQRHLNHILRVWVFLDRSTTYASQPNGLLKYMTIEAVTTDRSLILCDRPEDARVV